MVRYQPVRDRLVDVARQGRTITYGEVAGLLGLDAENPQDRSRIGNILTDISCSENAEGRPMLSAVVVLPEIGYPGKGFFLLARELGVCNHCDERSFFYYELKRVHEYWKNFVPDRTRPIRSRVPAHQGYTISV